MCCSTARSVCLLGQARLLVAVAVLDHHPRFAARTKPAHISRAARGLKVQLPVPLAAVAPQLNRAGKALLFTTASAANCSMPRASLLVRAHHVSPHLLLG